MKQNAIVCIALMVSATLFFGCLSTSTATPIKVPEADYKTVDSKAMSTGMSGAPVWYGAANESTSALKKLYPDSVPITVNGDGESLDAVKFQLETFAVNQALASQLSASVNVLAGQVTTTDGSAGMERAIEAFTAVASKAEFSGLTKEADYWILKEFKDGKRIYTYTVLYLMPQNLYDMQLDAILDELSPEDKEVIQPIVDKAKETIGDEY